jgi:hypothetical protein
LNNRVLNHHKCSIVTFTRKTKPLLLDYKVNGSILSIQQSIKDPGVIFNSKLTFVNNIRTIAGIAFRAMGFVLRIDKESSDVETLKLLYITYVRFRLEYASLVWSPIFDIRCSFFFPGASATQFPEECSFYVEWCISLVGIRKVFCSVKLVCSLCSRHTWNTR